jgi:hypothetical protein
MTKAVMQKHSRVCESTTRADSGCDRVSSRDARSAESIYMVGSNRERRNHTRRGCKKG